MTTYQQHCIIRTKALNLAEKKLRESKGQHPAFPWSAWGDRPRAGALWSDEELKAAKAYVDKEFKGQKLTIIVFAELAWLHGRSANGVYEKLHAVLGKDFYRKFEYL